MTRLNDRPDRLYPLPIFHHPARPFHNSHGGSVSRRVAQRYSLRSAHTTIVNNCIRSLNTLESRFSFNQHAPAHFVLSPDILPGSSSGLVLPDFHHTFQAVQESHVSSVQKCVLDNIISASSRLVGRSCPSDGIQTHTDTHLTDTDSGYYHKSAHPRVALKASKLALPVLPGSVDLLQSLSPPDQAFYSQLDNLIAKQPMSDIQLQEIESEISSLFGFSLKDDDKSSRVSVFASHSEYLSILLRLKSLDMLDFTLHPKAINGLFAVDKGDGTQRLIVDARPANRLFVRPPKVKLPTPDAFASLRTEANKPVFVAKVDIDSFFHRFVLPESLCPYFALPSVRAADVGVGHVFGNDAMVYPCLTRLPMGFSHSVYLAQAAHLNLIATHTSLKVEDMITKHGDPYVNRVRYGVYVDDLSFFGADKQSVLAAQEEYITAMQRIGLPIKISKVVRPTTSPTDIVGLQFDGFLHTYGLNPAKLRDLQHLTYDLIDSGFCSGDQLASLVGRWTWAALVNRPFLSVFRAVYRFIAVAKQRVFQIWPSVARELEVASGLAPLLFTRTSSPFLCRAVACDASQSGFGVSAAAVPDHLQQIASAGAGPLLIPPQQTAPIISHRLRAASNFLLQQLELGHFSEAVSDSLLRMLCSICLGSGSQQQPNKHEDQTGKDSTPHVLKSLQMEASVDGNSISQPHLGEQFHSSSQHTQWQPPEHYQRALRVLLRARWRTSFGCKWHFPLSHITEGEARAAFIAIRWVLSSPVSIGANFLLFSDSSGVVGALSKGRSSSKSLGPILRSVSAWLLAFSLRLHVVWVPTQFNPADFPSRHPGVTVER
jgi:hypothetical protein